jgi:hypothetical protein
VNAYGFVILEILIGIHFAIWRLGEIFQFNDSREDAMNQRVD